MYILPTKNVFVFIHNYSDKNYVNTYICIVNNI